MKVLSSGKLLYGLWKDGRQLGYSKVIPYEGDRFEGQIEANKKSGFGRVHYSNGDIYEGNFH